MKLEIKEFDTAQVCDVPVNERLKTKHVLASEKPRPKTGLYIRKSGRVVDIVKDVQIVTLAGRYRLHLSLSEAEILQLAKLCRRNRDDEAFLRAIEVAGEPKAKKVRSS